MRRALRHCIFLLICALGLLGNHAEARDVRVFAAASLTSALEEVGERWTSETGHRAVIVPAGSATLARQIQSGAPADIFVSANVAWMDILQAAGAIDAKSRRVLLTNRLTLVAFGAEADPLELTRAGTLAERLGDQRLAMAQVDAVPAGIYGKAALESLGHWPDIADQVAQAANVRAALALVASGEAPLGIVYATDAQAEPRVSVAAVFPADSHPQILYPAAIMADAQSPYAGRFLKYLAGPTAQEIFMRHGFGGVR